LASSNRQASEIENQPEKASRFVAGKSKASEEIQELSKKIVLQDR
jgi:hypothetical protein